MYLSAFAINGGRQILPCIFLQEGSVPPRSFSLFLFVFPPAWRILLSLEIFVQVFNMGYAGKDCICCRYQARTVFVADAKQGLYLL